MMRFLIYLMILVQLPDDISECAKFAKLFKEFNDTLEASKIQGFKWDKLEYKFNKSTVKLNHKEITYLVLLQRYKELSSKNSGGEGGIGKDIPYDIDGYITEIDTGKIDADYMNSRFDKYRKMLTQGDEKEIEKTLNELHKSFASLTSKEQKFANIFLHDVQNGDIEIDENNTLQDYITKYQVDAENSKITKLVDMFGLDDSKLKEMLSTKITDANLNEYGRFDELKNSVDKTAAKEYFEKLEGKTIPLFRINQKVHKLLKDFIINSEEELI